jgi:hypothetical protein
MTLTNDTRSGRAPFVVLKLKRATDTVRLMDAVDKLQRLQCHNCIVNFEKKRGPLKCDERALWRMKEIFCDKGISDPKHEKKNLISVSKIEVHDHFSFFIGTLRRITDTNDELLGCGWFFWCEEGVSAHRSTSTVLRHSGRLS